MANVAWQQKFIHTSTSWLTGRHGHGGPGHHPHGNATVGAGLRDGRGVHGCRHAVGLDHRRVVDDVGGRGIQRLRVIGALLL